MQHVRIEKLHDDVVPFTRGSEHSAGYDVRAFFGHIETVKVRRTNGLVVEVPVVGWHRTLVQQPGEVALVPLGFKAAIPPHLHAEVRPRSGISLKKGLVVHNAPGTIDADYPGEWMVMLRNTSHAPQLIEHGERIAQVVFSRYEVCWFDEGVVGVTTDRTGGFGSTGT